MSGNKWFPKPRPGLSVVEAAIVDLEDAQTKSVSRAVGTAAARNDKHLDLKGLLEQLRVYVEAIANANPAEAVSIVESAGMYVKDKRGPSKRGLHARQRKSREVEVSAPSAGNRAGYEFQHSLDAGKTWLPFPQPFTNYRTAKIELEPGTRVLFRYRAIVKGLAGDWSDPIAYIVE
jgi:hypothetical protein